MRLFQENLHLMQVTVGTVESSSWVIRSLLGRALQFGQFGYLHRGLE